MISGFQSALEQKSEFAREGVSYELSSESIIPPSKKRSRDDDLFLDRSIKSTADEKMCDLPDVYRTFIHRSKYARYSDQMKRRETWSETVDRYFCFFEKHLAEKHEVVLETETRSRIRNAVFEQRVMPSMRALMTAGPALERDHMAGYNCSYLAIDDVRAFDEILFILMCGTGVGFSVERQYIAKLPKVSMLKQNDSSVIFVADSKEGWALALRHLIDNLYFGTIPKWDLSNVREAGARLKTFGGRSSGPEPLNELFKYIVSAFKRAEGRKLTSNEVHGIVCKIAEIVVVGGVRRSALISLSNLSDDRMRIAKSGEWWIENPHYSLANNSVAYDETPEVGRFMSEWISLYNSKSGERGIFNRDACREHTKENAPMRDSTQDFGTNPCSEIILPNRGLCNLSEVIIRADDTPETLKEKVRIASIIGTWQSSLIDFRYVSSRWRENCEREHLLGVSLTGIMDNPFMAGRIRGFKLSERQEDKACRTDPFAQYDSLGEFLAELRDVAIKTNVIWASKLKIGRSHAVTTVKPSGTVSQLVDSASGIHTRHSRFYVRTVRGDVKDPLTTFMKDQGVPWEPCVMKPNDTVVFSFPIKSPEGCITRDDQDAISQLEICEIYNKNWCQHKVSVTINVKEREWFRVGAWVYDHFSSTSGISFLPHSDHCYAQAPYQECSEEEYHILMAKMPTIDWLKLAEYETSDMTNNTKELACSAGVCELI